MDSVTPKVTLRTTVSNAPDARERLTASQWMNCSGIDCFGTGNRPSSWTQFRRDLTMISRSDLSMRTILVSLMLLAQPTAEPRPVGRKATGFRYGDDPLSTLDEPSEL
jgi:hypothetical protein